MRYFVLLLFTGSSVLGQRYPGLFRDEELESFSVTIHPKSQKVVEGSPIVLTCISSLRTYTEFQWKIGFKPVTSDHERRHGSDEKGMHIHQTADNISVLRIDSVNMKEHRRKISCEATVETGGLSGTAQSSIKIFKKGSKRKGFPTLQSYPESPAVYRTRDSLSLSCTSNIGPKSREAPEWRWIKNGTWDLGLYEEMEERMEISDSGTLEIFSVMESDAGTYECVAENRRGSSFSPPTEVIVEPEATASQRSCEDRNFQTVPHGSIYQPYPDPCMECECVDGAERYCTTIMCDEPPCRNYEIVADTCCGFTCLNDTISVWSSEEYGTCMPYTGTGCKEFLEGRNVYIRPRETQDSVKNQLKMLFRGAQSLSESCMEYILPFLCFNTVPLCDSYGDRPRGRHVCREDCEMVADKCQDELIVFRDQYTLYSGNDPVALPRCTELPTRSISNEPEGCVSFEHFLDIDRSTDVDGMELPDWPGTPRRDSNSDGDQCIDRLGNLVNDGDLYLPERDPCLACVCDEGSRSMCTVVACEPPPCRNYEKLNDSCCGYVCKENGDRERDFIEMGEPCIANNGSYILNGEYQPGPDPCVKCRCVNGRQLPCRTVMCIPPRCPKYAPNSVPVPDTCCEFECHSEETRTGGEEIGLPTEPCIASNGTYIMNGKYHPTGDLCTTCFCENGVKQPCMSVGCYPPQCPNRVKVPGTCCEFRCGEDGMSDMLDRTSPQAPGSISVQQVGSTSAIVQWKLDKMWKMNDHSQLTLLYNCTMNSTLTNVTVPADLTYILLNDLHINEKYQFILLSTSPEKRVVLDVVNFTLTGRVGQSLFLGDVSNGNVYESRGSNSDQGYMFLPVRNRNNSHIMLRSFHHVELRKTKNPPCRITSGCNVMQFSLYNGEGYSVAVLALMFDDERDFNWAKAHL